MYALFQHHQLVGFAADDTVQAVIRGQKPDQSPTSPPDSQFRPLLVAGPAAIYLRCRSDERRGISEGIPHWTF